jgi:hypothetical protein
MGVIGPRISCPSNVIGVVEVVDRNWVEKEEEEEDEEVPPFCWDSGRTQANEL